MIYALYKHITNMKRLILLIFLLLLIFLGYTIFLNKGKDTQKNVGQFWKGNVDSLKELFQEQTKTYFKTKKDWRNYIETINNTPYNDVLKELKVVEDTMRVYLKAEDYAFAYLYHIMGVQYYLQKIDFNKALELYTKALNIRQEYPDSLSADEIANTYYNIGSVYLELGYRIIPDRDSFYNEALPFYEQALKLRKSNAQLDYIKLKDTYEQLAIVYKNKGNYRKELRFRQAATTVTDSVFKFNESLSYQDTFFLAENLMNVGLTHERLGNYVSSISYLEKAIQLFYTSQSWEEEMITRGKLANVYLEFQPKVSLNIYQQILQEYAELDDEEVNNKDSINLADFYNNAGVALQELYRQDSAIIYFKKSLDLNQSLKERAKEIRNNYENLAASYLELSQYDIALNYLEDNLEAATQEEDWEFLAGTHENFGDVYTAQIDYDKALQNYQKSLQYLVPSFKDNNLRTNPSLKMISHNKIDLTRVLSLKALTFKSKFDKTAQIDDLNDALNSFSLVDTLITQIRQSFQNTDSKFLLQQNIKPIYESAIQTALEIYKYTKNEKYIQTAYHFCAKNKAIVLLEGIQHEIAQFRGLPTEVLNQEQDFIEKITQLESELSERRDKQDSLQLVSQLFNVKRAYEGFIEGLEEQYPRYYELKYSAQQPETIENIQAKLEENRAVVEYFVGVDDIYIFVASRHDFNYYKLSKSKNFNKHYDTFRRDILEQQDDYDFLIYKDIANQLYQVLLEQPLQDLDSTITRLTFIPDEELLSLSFDVLPYRVMTNEDRNRPPYLIRKWATSLAYSNRLLFDSDLKQRFKNYQKKFGGFALDYKNFGQKKWNLPDSLYLQNRDMDELPYSVREIRQAGSLYKNTAVFINEQATRSAFLRETESTNYKVLHLAMHGIVLNERPLQSGLIFYQEKDTLPHILRAREIYAQNISTDLLILSACNTGYGAISTGEGIRSLARSFAYAGCPSIMASLWTANDMSSKEITLPFHQFIKDGLPKDVALQSAKLTYLDSKSLQANFKNPYYWAHFAVIGDVGAVFEAGSFGIWGMLFFVFVVGLFLMYIRLWR